MIRCDFLIAGAGVVGLCLARELKRRHRGCSVVVLEKESSAGRHASGRNSGVLHAGFYYSPDSLKARFTRVGNKAMQQFCSENGLPIRRCGKLVVATTAAELPILDGLFHRGMLNGVDLYLLSAQEAKEVEPRAKVFERAIFSPATASVDPKAVMRSLVARGTSAGIDIRFSEGFHHVTNGIVHSKTNAFDAGYFVNCAGLYADKIAHQFDHGRHHRILAISRRELSEIGRAGGRLSNTYLSCS